MIELPYSLVIEATEEPDYFGFFSPNLEGFTGIGYSVEDCLYQVKWGMKEHVALLRQRGLPVPEHNVDPRIVIQNAKEHSTVCRSGVEKWDIVLIRTSMWTAPRYGRASRLGMKKGEESFFDTPCT